MSAEAEKLPLAERLRMSIGLWAGGIAIETTKSARVAKAVPPLFVTELVREVALLERNTAQQVRVRLCVISLVETELTAMRKRVAALHKTLDATKSTRGRTVRALDKANEYLSELERAYVDLKGAK